MPGSETTKVILKSVRDAIKSEKFADAIEKCTDLLKTEPENYMAYLLLGAAYQHVDKAEAAKQLWKAVEYSPGPPTVALQGLANCAAVDQLPGIYEQLFALMPAKAVEYYAKLYEASSSAAVAQECFGIFKREHLSNRNEPGRELQALRYLARLWVANDYAVADDENQLYKKALETIIADPQLAEYLAAYKRYLFLLYKLKDFANCIKHACAVVEQYPLDVYAYEWICKICCEQYSASDRDDWQRELKLSPQDYANKLLQLNENSGLALLLQAFDLNGAQQFVAARANLQRVQRIQPNYTVAWDLLARVYMELGAYGLAITLWEKLNRTQEWEYAWCLANDCDAEKIRNVLPVLEQMPQNDLVIYALARYFHKVNDEAKLKALPLDVLSKAEFTMTPTDAVEYLQANADLESFPVLMLLGKLQLQLGLLHEGLTTLLKATRLKPHRSECFYYLGKLYYATNDMERARKCFEKCLNLNPLCEDAVNNLSAIYQQLGEEELNAALLLTTLKFVQSEASKRVYYKLGLHYLHVKRCDDAIQAFRTAIKYDVSCMIYWESLADAYAERGSYNSAIRVFQKILEMDAGNIYAKLQIARIRTTVRMYSDAINDFDELLQTHPDYLPGLKGAAEAHIGLASHLKSKNLYGRSKDHLQMAVNHLQRIFLTHDNHEMVWLWRLTANVFLECAQMPPSMANLSVAGKLAKRETELVLLTRDDLLHLAIRFYTCALKLKQNTFLWYELALCCYHAANFVPANASVHLELALKACKMAIKEQGNRWQNWNLLGVLHMHNVNKNLPVAQHCFIHALQLERKSYITWTNLGVLYLHLGEIKLANQAFQRAQQASPIYANAWIGQSMIAEAIAEREEAFDLFRHCQQFDYHPESAVGFANWVCTILTNAAEGQLPHNKYAIKTMYADVLALDAINLYVANEEENASLAALSFQGFLNVRQKLYRPAVKAYEQAVQKTAGVASDERDKMLANLGFLYLKLKQPQQAINAFNAIGRANFKPIIGLALAYVHAGQHQEAYTVYNSVLKSVADTDDDKAASILVAMASMVYASQGEADTKTILYQCILIKNSPIEALYSACALGILHHDNQLSETILTELKKCENSQQHCAHIAYLTAQYYLANNAARKGLLYLLSRIHVFPHCGELRKVLANYMLDNFGKSKGYRLPTSQMALQAIRLVQASDNSKSDCIEDSNTLLLASRALEPVDKRESLKLMQCAVHMHPQNQHAWRILLEAH